MNVSAISVPPEWLPTSSTGPRGGMFSSPRTSARNQTSAMTRSAGSVRAMYSGSRSSKGSAAGGLRARWRGSAAWATSADMARSIRASAETAPSIRPIPPPRRSRTTTGSARRCACRSVVCGIKRLLGRLRPYGRGRRCASVSSTECASLRGDRARQPARYATRYVPGRHAAGLARAELRLPLTMVAVA